MRDRKTWWASLAPKPLAAQFTEAKRGNPQVKIPSWLWRLLLHETREFLEMAPELKTILLDPFGTTFSAGKYALSIIGCSFNTLIMINLGPSCPCFHHDFHALLCQGRTLRLLQIHTGATVTWMGNRKWPQGASTHQRWKQNEPAGFQGGQ